MPGSAAALDVAEPVLGPGEARVRVLEVGVCGIDVEIDAGARGEAPEGDAVLVLGHESLGEIEAMGRGAHGSAPGDLVVAMVRRPDGCTECIRGEPDMCVGGRYTESGIRGRHGFLAERYTEHTEFLVRVPARLRACAVLLEPLANVEKGVRQALAVQRRLRAWEPRRALVLGAGAVGLLGALVLRLQGIETIVYACGPDPVRARWLDAIGATYLAKRDASGSVAHHLADLPSAAGPFDLVLEATGSAHAATAALRLPGPDGIACLPSVKELDEELRICATCLDQVLVPGNRAAVGAASAHRMDFDAGIRDLAEAEDRWPGWAQALVTRRVPLARFRDALSREPGDVKVVIEPGR